MPPIAKFTSGESCTQRKREANPRLDAARMAALKKLRHKLVVLCSSSVQKAGGQALPVLCFERWLARYALRRDEAINKIVSSGSGNSKESTAEKIEKLKSSLDPLVPSDGFVDRGLVKDLNRSKVPFDTAKQVAATLASEAKEAAIRIQEENPDRSLDTHDRVIEARKRAKKDIKAALKDIKAKSKAAQEALGVEAGNADTNDDSNNDQNDRNSNIISTLRDLKSATLRFEEKIQLAQRDAVKPITTGTCGGISINGARREGIYDITLKGPNGKPNRPYLTVSRQHLCKLIQLWTIQGDDKDEGEKIAELDVDPIKPIDAMPETDQPRIRMAIYCCLSRYEALRGAGYQCAVPGIAFDAASKCGLGTTIECFASPLNCRYRRYCSAFPDIEHQFGSVGSFFDDNSFNPNEGSFEANPPFVPETMDAMGDKIQRLLDDPKRGPLSFLVVIPAWGAGSAFCQKLQKSSHTRANALIPAADHAYYDGAQHTKLAHSEESLLRPSSWDTAVILMQNDLGTKVWPVEEDKLRETFCVALTDAAKTIPDSSSTLDKWERRGVSGGGSLNRHGLDPMKQDKKRKR